MDSMPEIETRKQKERHERKVAIRNFFHYDFYYFLV